MAAQCKHTHRQGLNCVPTYVHKKRKGNKKQRETRKEREERGEKKREKTRKGEREKEVKTTHR
jgi:hypothetical protein